MTDRTRRPPSLDQAVDQVLGAGAGCIDALCEAQVDALAISGSAGQPIRPIA